MKTVTGDLIKMAAAGEFDVIIHGANCFLTMGAGIAKQIKQTFPEAYMADLKTTKGDKKKLGTFSSAKVRCKEHQLIVVNAYTQHTYSAAKDVVLVDYDAVRSVFEAVKKEFAGLRIGYPKIGSGLANGSWDRIAAIIEKALDGEDHTLVVWQPPYFKK